MPQPSKKDPAKAYRKAEQRIAALSGESEQRQQQLNQATADTEALEQQLAALEDIEPMCRYWALIGLQAQPMNETILQAASCRSSTAGPPTSWDSWAGDCTGVSMAK